MKIPIRKLRMPRVIVIDHRIRIMISRYPVDLSDVPDRLQFDMQRLARLEVAQQDNRLGAKELDRGDHGCEVAVGVAEEHQLGS